MIPKLKWILGEEIKKLDEHELEYEEDSDTYLEEEPGRDLKNML